MHLIYALIIGLLIGLVARLITPGPNPQGFILTSLLGIVGAVVATYIGQAMNMYAPGEPAGFFASVIGAVLVLAVFHMVVRSKGTSIR
jgi:uncharacterized membrane protein YeaQ/YmgE (transglycosylase-associated protein family)